MCDNKYLNVKPTEISKTDPLYVNGTLNAVTFSSEHSGQQTIIGRGAGGMETASAILRDLIVINTFLNIPLNPENMFVTNIPGFHHNFLNGTEVARLCRSINCSSSCLILANVFIFCSFLDSLKILFSKINCKTRYPKFSVCVKRINSLITHFLYKMYSGELDVQAKRKALAVLHDEINRILNSARDLSAQIGRAS